MRCLAILLCVGLLAPLACGPRPDGEGARPAPRERIRTAQAPTPEPRGESPAAARRTEVRDGGDALATDRISSIRDFEPGSVSAIDAAHLPVPELARKLVEEARRFESAGSGIALGADRDARKDEIEAIFQVSGEDFTGEAVEWNPVAVDLDAEAFRELRSGR